MRQSLHLIQRKNAPYKWFLRSKSKHDLHNFKKFSTYVANILHKAKRNHFYSIFSAECMSSAECMNNTVQVWKRLNNLLNQNSSYALIYQITVNGMPLRKGYLAKAFHNYFINLVKSSRHRNANQSSYFKKWNQGIYQPWKQGKSGIIREFRESGKVRETWGNFRANLHWPGKSSFSLSKRAEDI